MNTHTHCVLFVWFVLYLDLCLVLRCVSACCYHLPSRMFRCQHMCTSAVEVLSDQDLSSRLFTFTRGRGLTLTSARVLVRAHVDGQARNPPTHWTTLHVYVVLQRPLGPCNRRMCVSSLKRLGCLHVLAHAAGQRHLCGASTPKRSDPSV